MTKKDKKEKLINIIMNRVYNDTVLCHFTKESRMQKK
jgi:hypothetical protein